MSTKSRSHRTTVALACAAAGLLLIEGAAQAHITIISGNAPSATTQDVVFDVGHGCSGADTYSVTIAVPAAATGARPMLSEFGPATVVKDASNVTHITWTKTADANAGDTNNYKLVVRVKTPDAPFTTLFFYAQQVCKVPGMTPMDPVEWVDTPASTDGGALAHPAPTLVIVPPHSPGWNKYTLAADVPDPSLFFKDASIVWKGSAAYSSNATTAKQISATTGVTALTSLKSGDAISVKY
jgi:uncharacterized protein YcnI